MIDVVQRRDTGRPELVYSLRRHKDVEHSVMVTEFRLLFMDSPFTPEAVVGQTRADGVMLRDGKTCYVEIDNSQKMTTRQMSDKWKRYGHLGKDVFILLVCRTEARMARLLNGAESVRDHLLVTTWNRLESGMTEPWTDCFGNSARV